VILLEAILRGPGQRSLRETPRFLTDRPRPTRANWRLSLPDRGIEPVSRRGGRGWSARPADQAVGEGSSSIARPGGGSDRRLGAGTTAPLRPTPSLAPSVAPASRTTRTRCRKRVLRRRLRARRPVGLDHTLKPTPCRLVQPGQPSRDSLVGLRRPPHSSEKKTHRSVGSSTLCAFSAREQEVVRRSRQWSGGCNRHFGSGPGGMKSMASRG
jgi:hypothetical protein